MWLRATFPIIGEDPLSDLGTSLSADPRVVRGRELLDLGLYDQARPEFEFVAHGLRRRRRGDVSSDAPVPRPGPVRSGDSSLPAGARPGRPRRRRNAHRAALLQPHPLRALLRRPDLAGSADKGTGSAVPTLGGSTGEPFPGGGHLVGQRSGPDAGHSEHRCTDRRGARLAARLHRGRSASARRLGPVRLVLPCPPSATPSTEI